MNDDLDALSELWEAWARIGREMDEQQWRLPTRNSEWDVKATYAHHSQAVWRLAQFAVSPTDLPIDHASAAEFLGQFGRRPDDGRLVAEAAKAESAAATTGELVATFAVEGPKAITAARGTGDVVVQTDEGRIRFSEYVRTRIVESVVHLLDVEAALGLPTSVPEAGLRRAAHVLVDFTPLVDFVDMSTGRSDKRLFPVFT